MLLSIVIPTLNEEKNIATLVPYLWQYGGQGNVEIIIVDAVKSKDNGDKIAQHHGAKVIKSEVCCRAVQLNLGAQHAQGDILYFIHADVIPTKTYYEDIIKAIQKGKDWGFFSYQFNSKKWLLRFNAYYTRFNGLFSGGGDQTLFIKKSIFHQIGRFREDYKIMEDFELTRRLKAQQFPFCIIKKDVIVSARKYEKNNYFKVNLVNFWVFLLFLRGDSQDKIIQIYKKWIL